MGAKNDQQEVQPMRPTTERSRLHQVTPLSKYLAMALFVILPFLGGWIGYTYAPEEVVTPQRSANQQDMVESHTTESGITLDGAELDSYSVKDFVESEESVQNFLNDVANTYALNETFSMTGSYRTYEKTAWGATEQCHGLQLSRQPANFWHLKTLLNTLGGNSVNPIEDKRLVINLPWDEMSEEAKEVISSNEQVTLELSAKEPTFTSVGPCYSEFEFIRIVDN